MVAGGGHHAWRQGDVQSWVGWAHEQPIRVLKNAVIRSDSSRASGWAARWVAWCWSGRIRSLVRADFRPSLASTALVPITTAWSISPSSRWLVASAERSKERLRAMSGP